jgi:alpha/beta hydrolase family protein
VTTVDVETIAGWDVPLARQAVARVDEAGNGLPGWRVRLDEAAQQLSAGGLWSGPGGVAAAGGLAELVGAATTAMARLGSSVWDLERLVVEAGWARDAADQAVGMAPQVTVAPDPGAVIADRVRALTDTAQQHAAQAAQAAADAVASVPTELRSVSPPTAGSAVPADLAAGVGVPIPPAGQGPEAAARWWSGLTAVQQLLVVSRTPGALGGLAGVPARARDRANRLVIARELSRGTGTARETAAAVAAQVTAREADGQVVQVLELDLDEGLAAVALGDLDTAASVGVLVPGTGNTVADDLDAVLDSAEAVGAAAAAAAPGTAVATVAWMSYRTPPSLPAAALSGRAQVGGRALDATLDGMAAARARQGGPPPRVVTVGHSYGAVVVDAADDAPGPMATDAVIVLGDPGMDGPGWSLEAEEAYRGRALFDPIRCTPDEVHGPSDDLTGYTSLPTDLTMGHSDYYDADHPTVWAVGRVLVDVE